MDGLSIGPSFFLTFITLIATIGSVILKVWKQREGAFEEYRRCKRLLRNLSDSYEESRKNIVYVTRCLRREEHANYIEDLLFKHSNIVAEIGEFVENGCPKIHEQVSNMIKKYLLLGSVYLTLGLTLSFYGQPSPLATFFSIVYGIFGITIIYATGPRIDNEIEELKLALDAIEDNAKIVERNINKLTIICEKEQD